VETEGGYSGLITAFTDGGNPIRFWFYHMFRGDLVALLMVVPAAVLLFLTWRIYRRWMS
jgi:PTS system galactitol-specific IIC component